MLLEYYLVENNNLKIKYKNFDFLVKKCYIILQKNKKKEYVYNIILNKFYKHII